MRKRVPVLFLLLLTVMLSLAPAHFALAETALNTELVVNGGAEAAAPTAHPGWTDLSGTRWSSSAYYSPWPAAPEGSQYFFLYAASLESLSSSMTQSISLSGTEGTGLFSAISAGNIAMHFSVKMYQSQIADNEVKVIVEQYSASDALLATSNVVSTAAGSGSFSDYELNTQLNPSTRKFKLTLNATLTTGQYAQYDAISLMLVDASTGSAPVFGSDFPTEGTTDANVAYSHGFTITDADAGDIDMLTFSVNSDNINLVPASSVAVSGSGTSRTLTITPVSNLSGEANVTVTASDGTKSAEASIHLVVSKVIALGSNLVENGNATSGFASWEGSDVNIVASGNGFVISSTNYGMYQHLDISKYSAIINGGAADYELKVSGIGGTSGQVVLQFYSDIACTAAVGGSVTVNNSTLSRSGVVPINAKGAVVTFSSTGASGVNCTIRDISLVILNNFPKMNAVDPQTSALEALTVPVDVYYTSADATLSATSSDQTIVTDSGMTAGGSGFHRTLTFTPLKQGTVTITATVNDGTSTASRTFDVTVHEPAVISNVQTPDAGYYAPGADLDFTFTFSRNIQGGSLSTLPLTIDGWAEDATYETATDNTIVYRYTPGSSDSGAVVLGTAIDDTLSPITDTDSYAAQLDFTGGDTNIIVIPTPEVTSTATAGTAIYGTQLTFTMSLTCADTLTGVVQFQSDGVALGSPVTLSGNQASYQTTATELDAGTHQITASFIPSGSSCQFTSLPSSACSVAITPKTVSVTGLCATGRAYDGTTAVDLSGGALSGVLSGDTVTGVFPTIGAASSANAGTWDVAFDDVTLTGTDQGNYAVSAQPTVSVILTAKPITFTATAANKVYDGTATATVSGVTFDGLITGETLTADVDYTATGVFASTAINNDIAVTVTVTLKDTPKADNYTLSASTAATQADITKKLVTITGVTATGRAYNGDTAVGLSGGTLAGVEAGDAADVGFMLGDGVMADADAGSAKPVTTSITLTGDAADAYTLTQPTTVTVNIAKVDLTLTDAAAEDKAYDGSTAATVTDVSVSGAIPGETLAFGTDYMATGLFSNAAVGTDKTVTVTVTLATTGPAKNYALPVNTIETQADITNSGVTITGVTATDRAYDGTTAVALEGGTLVGIAPADAAGIGFALNQGTLTSAAAGNDKAVTTAITLTGTNAGNYTLTQPTGITVDIAKASLSIAASTISEKAYDTTTDATVTGVSFTGLATGEALTANVDYTASGVFSSADIGMPIDVAVTVTLADTATARNYAMAGTGTASGQITPCPISGSVAIDVTNGTGSPLMLDEGDEMRVNVSGVSAPGTPTYSYQWCRNGTGITGASGATYTIGNLATDPIGTYYTVKATGTGNYADTLESAPVTVATVALAGTLSIQGDTKRGSVLTLNASALTPAAATYDIVWLCGGTAITGETSTTHTITKTDQNKTLTVTVTGKGYFSGTVSASIDIPPSPYPPDTSIVTLSDRVEVDLTTGSTLMSEEQMILLYELNATRPIVFKGAGYTITFAARALQMWSGDLNLGVRFNTGTGYAAIVGGTGSSFVLMFEFLHSGLLPGEAQITMDVDKKYVGQVLRHLYYNPDTGKLDLIETLLVDPDGHVTFTQDHCSSYALARLRSDSVPKTGDSTPLVLWWTLAGVCTAGLLTLFIWRLRKKRR